MRRNCGGTVFFENHDDDCAGVNARGLFLVSKDLPIRLVTGMSRSGTSSMIKTLSRCPDTVTFGETKYWSSEWIEPGADGLYGERQLAQIASRWKSRPYVEVVCDGQGGPSRRDVAQAVANAIDDLIEPIAPGPLFEHMGQTIAGLSGRAHWVEKSPNHIRHLDRIARYCSDFRALLMVRSPEEFLLSYKHQGDRKIRQVREKLHSLYHPAVTARICRGYFEAALNAASSYPGNTRITFLETLIDCGQQEIEEIEAFLGLAPSGAQTMDSINSSFQDQSHKRPPLTDVERDWLALLVGRKAAELGYDTPSFSGEHLRLAASATLLAPWLSRNFKLLNQKDRAGFLGFAVRWIR